MKELTFYGITDPRTVETVMSNACVLLERVETRGSKEAFLLVDAVELLQSVVHGVSRVVPAEDFQAFEQWKKEQKAEEDAPPKKAQAAPPRQRD